MHHDIRSIAAAFRILGDFQDARTHGTGHINDTYAAVFSQGGAAVRYIFQRINHDVFKDPPALMENVVRVTSHVRAKLSQQGIVDVSRRVLTVVPTREGACFHRDAEGNYWRVYVFIENATTYDVVASPRQAYEAARAFGSFQSMLVDLPGPPLHETIRDFHNGQMRFRAFLDALETDVCNRAASAGYEIGFLQRHASILDVLPSLVAKGEIPVRVTHNDTKLNNVMLDLETGEGVCVIDLDTLMPGLVLYDFGDIVRTSTSPALEDERDLCKVTFLLPRFEAIVRGFLETAGRSINRAERDHLVLGGKLITLIIGMRFLTDYLVGDKYFKTHREGHNLDRCRTQFALVASMEAQEDEMQALVERNSPGVGR